MDRVKIAFGGVGAVLLLAVLLFWSGYADRYFPSGEILGIPLDTLGQYLFYSLILLGLGWRLIGWLRRGGVDELFPSRRDEDE